MRPLALLIALALVVALAPGCTLAGGDGWPDPPGPKGVASFAPVQCFALNVAGDDAVVRPAMTTQGPHHFEPGPADVRMLARADMLLINGLQLDDQVGKKLATGAGKNFKLVNLGARLPDSMLLEG